MLIRNVYLGPGSATLNWQRIYVFLPRKLLPSSRIRIVFHPGFMGKKTLNLGSRIRIRNTDFGDIYFKKTLEHPMEIVRKLRKSKAKTVADISMYQCWGSVTVGTDPNPGSIPLANVSRSDSGSDSLLQWLKGWGKNNFFIFFSYNLPAGILSSFLKFNIFSNRFLLKFLFCKHYLIPLNTLKKL